MAKSKELPEVVVTQEGRCACLPKSTAMAYRGRSFARFYKRGVRQAAAALLGCLVGDVRYHEAKGFYYCLLVKVKFDRDLGKPAAPRKRYRSPSRF